MVNMITVDGNNYSMICNIERTATIRSSNNSDYLMDGTYHNDVIGTYLTYTVSLVVPKGKENNYASLYEVLTNPVASHRFVLPYNNGTIAFDGRVQEISDTYYRREGNKAVWRYTTFEVTANEPIKTAGEAVVG